MRTARFAILEEPQIGTPETAESTTARLFIKNEWMHIVKLGYGLNGRWNVAHNGRWKNAHADTRWCSYPGKTACTRVRGGGGWAGEGRFQKNKKYSDGNSGENTKGTIDGENFSARGGGGGRGGDVDGRGMRYWNAQTRRKNSGRRKEARGRPWENTLLPLWSFSNTFFLIPPKSLILFFPLDYFDTFDFPRLFPVFAVAT